MNFCLPLKTFVYSFDYKNQIRQFEERPGCDKQYVTALHIYSYHVKF